MYNARNNINILTLEKLDTMTEDQLIAHYSTPDGLRELAYYPRLAEMTVEEAVAEMMLSLNLKGQRRKMKKDKHEPK